jgi:hypothetical protein
MTKEEEPQLTEQDLTYAAYSRCPCGAGLAYVPKLYGKDNGAWDYWDCSDILLDRAIPKGQAGAVTHTGKLPFMFWEVLSENQPSAQGATTRPTKQ